MRKPLRILSAAAVCAVLVAHNALAATITLGFADGVTETEYVADQNSTNTQNLFGSAGSGNSKLVGSVNSGRDEFIVVSVDLSSVPDSSVITGADLTWGVDGSDGNSVQTANPLVLYELVGDPNTTQGHNYRYQSFGPDGSSDPGMRADNVQWDGEIGEIPTGDAVASDFFGAELSSIPAGVGGYDVTTAADGDSFTFASSAAFVGAIQSNLADDLAYLVFGIPALDVGPDDGLRSFLRYDEDSAVLILTVVPEPSSLLLVSLAGVAGMVRRK